jgi:hypothetical protein
MMHIHRSKLFALITATTTAALFLWAVLGRPNAFNMLPYSIHESFSPGGESERTFIIIFDIIFALLILALVFKITGNFVLKS